MPQDQLVSYIKKTLEKGYSYDQIRKVLLNTGHTDEEIEKAYNKVEGGEEGKPKIKKSYLLYLLIGIAVALLVISFPFFMKNGGNIGIGNQDKPTEKLNISCTNLADKRNQEACRLCKRINDNNMKYSCFAMVAEDEKMCKQATGNRLLSCYLLLALKTRNNSYCTKSENEGLCEALVANDSRMCENVKKDNQLDNQLICDLYFAYERNDSEIISEIINQEPWNMDYFKAFLNGESQYCDSIENEDLRVQCLFRLSILKSDPSPCLKVETNTDFCRSLAERNIPESSCQNYPSFCVLSAIFSGESSICEKVPKPHRGICYNNFVSTEFKLLSPKLLLALAP